jgi:LacI family transcriptional regulator
MPRTPRVAVLLNPGRSYDRGLLRGIARYVNLHGGWVSLRPAAYYERFSGLVDQNVAELRRSRLHGIITNDTPAARRFADLGIPMVVVPSDHEFPGAIRLWGDNRGVATMAAEHLRELGLQQYAFVGFDRAGWSLERADAFRQRVAEMRCSLQTHLIPLNPKEREKGRHRAQLVTWLTQLPRPVGIMACNDELALTISQLCHHHGIRLPDEMALIGTDNDELVCQLSNPPLSSVAFATEQAGYEAAACLDQVMRGKKRRNDDILARASHIVARASTDVLAIEDGEVVKALRFIQQNAHRVLRVAEVVEATLYSQWTLNQCIQRIFGHSILKEVNRRRARHIGRLLSEKDLPIERIARDLGYESQAHLARYFRREMGMSPRAYRKLHPTTEQERSGEGQNGSSF